MIEHERNDVKFIGIGYHDACINFLVKFANYRFDQLEQAITNVGDYNEFNGATVVKTFAKIKHLVYQASFGREGSPVLYLYINRGEFGNEPIGVQEVLDEFSNMRKSKPDEIDVDEYNPALVRLWWD